MGLWTSPSGCGMTRCGHHGRDGDDDRILLGTGYEYVLCPCYRYPRILISDINDLCSYEICYENSVGVMSVFEALEG